ncbi:carbohydrate ABC transporter permease [Paenibacillus cisolokensis]|jgi:ABC-type sugar transport system, permease component|uniref:carbohydrate ABC transporter permease n=1 Tax=Paenibacillus TaxID=44249 RepID=UPI0007206108|nr:carbohydrate ABC transporter permease [Paenibacillus sp. 32O-W]ALS28000.1 ABC transporter permease [Paenibacillus sp. 32O-W]
MKPDIASIVRSARTVDKKMIENGWNKLKKFLLGKQGNDGIVFKLVVYALLISIGFVYLYPIFYMLSQSLKSLDDLLDPTVLWLPKTLHLENYVQAWKVLDFTRAFGASLLNSVLPAIAQTVSCALVGYGFARFRFPGKNVMLAFILLTFIIPVQVVMIPLFLLFQQYGMLGSPLPFIVPALFAGGLKSALFILIYLQFFKTVPKALEESAQIDGAGAIKTFFRIIMPISVPAIVVVFLFSLVWHWNETYTTSLYLGESMRTLPLKLQSFDLAFSQVFTSSQTSGDTANINESIKLAGTMLIILPLLILYLFAQRWFVEVIDKTGITGE